MATSTRQIIENPYKPRAWSLPFHARHQRFSVLVCHRRAGKTVACIGDLIDKAVQNHLPYPQYAYICPLYKQAKNVAWGYLKRMSVGVVDRVMESELSVTLKNGATIRLYGADNVDALRGIYLDGVILDEYAQMSSRLFGEVIAPTLADRQGWAVFIGTPQGKNAFYDLWEDALEDQRWLTFMLKASESGIIPPEELDIMRSLPGANEGSYEQEFECSFTAAIRGAYYGRLLNELEHMTGDHPWDPDRPVMLSFDIGISDQTSIWFFQSDGQTYRMIDFFSESGYSVDDILSMLRTKPYAYGTMYLPHDAKNKSFQTGKSVRELMVAAGCEVRIVPSLSILDGIAAVRATLPKVYFNTKNADVKDGLNSLKLYKSEYDEKRNILKDTPLHDQHSDPADSFRYFALAMNPGAAKHAASQILQARKPEIKSNVMNLENLFAERARAASATKRI